MYLYLELPAWLKNKFTRSKILWSLFALLNIAITVIIWYKNSHYYITTPEDGNMWIALGRLTGLLGELALLMELVLIGRITTIEQAFGFDKMNKLHRWIGYSILIFLLSHPLFLTIGNAQGYSLHYTDQFIEFLAHYEDVFAAFVGLVLFGYVIVLSLPVIRKKMKYETWYFTHLLMYLAIGLAFQHQTVSGDMARSPALYYWYAVNFIVFGGVLLYRFIKPLYVSWRHGFVVEHVALETPDTYSVYITGKNIGQFSYKAGQYANITFLQKGLWFTHPFSFSAEPNDAYVRFTMKAVGDYTKKLGELKPGTRVILDGPLGLFIEDTAKSEKLLLIAGGIGVTPLRSLMGDLVKKKKDFVLLYAARTEADIAFRKEFEHMQTLAPFKIHYILGTPTPGYESGFLDREKIVRLVPDFFDRDVFLCGPPPMMAATVKNLEGLGLHGAHLHYEKFSF